MSNSQFKTVTIAGGTGTLGYAISEAFLNDGSYNVKILRKKPENENEKAKLLDSKGAEIVYVESLITLKRMILSKLLRELTFLSVL